MRELVNLTCEENNLQGPTQVSLGYDFKNNSKNLKKIGELKLRIKELEFLERLERKESELNNGNFKSELIEYKDEYLRTEKEDLEILLQMEVENVKKDLGIDLTHKLDLKDLHKLNIVKAFISFETKKAMKEFKKSAFSQVSNCL